jgi:hypothetical protein
MNRSLINSLMVVYLLMLGGAVIAQDKPNPPKEEAKNAPTMIVGPQVKVQFVFTEFEGEKKVKSLPYNMVIDTSHMNKLRIGSRVPVATGKENGGVQFQYFDVGTNLDCAALPVQDGKFQLRLSLERSWVEGDVSIASEKVEGQGKDHSDSIFRQPVIHQFKFEDTIVLRDGQTLETNYATDPLTGKVAKLEVTLNVVK